MGVLNPSTFTILTYRAFEPTEISGLKGWWKADSIDQADNTSVSAWLDSSGNEAHMYQSSATAQPTLQANELNGYPVVRFDGTNDFMNLTAPFDVQPTAVSTYDCTAFSNDGQYVAHANANTSPRIFIYKKNGNVFNKLADPATIPTGQVNGLSFSFDNKFLAVAHNTSPFITIYERNGDSFVKLSNPANLPSGNCINCCFSNNNSFLAISQTTSPYITIYSISGTTFTKLADPATIPTGASYGISFSPDNSYLAIGFQTSPYINFYSISGTTFTKLTNPTVLPSANINSISFLNTSEKVALSQETGNILIYDIVSSLFQQSTTISTSGVTRSLRFSRNGNFLAVAHATSPFFTVFSRSENTFTSIQNPESLPISTGRGVAWGTDDLTLIVSHSTAPFIQAYSFNGTTLTNLTKLNMFRNVGGATVFQVIKYATGTATDTAFTVLSGTGGYRIVSFKDNTTNLFRSGGRRLDANTAQFVTSAQTASASSFYIQTGLYDFSNSNLYQYINSQLDGTSLNFQTDGLTSNTDSIAIYLSSTGDFLNGDIAEVIAFNRVLTTAEIRDVHYYLSAKYNIILAT